MNTTDLSKAPLGLDVYEPSPVEEGVKYWAYRYPNGTFLSDHRSHSPQGWWRLASTDPNGVLSVLHADLSWKGTVDPYSGSLVQGTLAELTPRAGSMSDGVAILDSQGNPIEFIRRPS